MPINGPAVKTIGEGWPTKRPKDLREARFGYYYLYALSGDVAYPDGEFEHYEDAEAEAKNLLSLGYAGAEQIAIVRCHAIVKAIKTTEVKVER